MLRPADAFFLHAETLVAPQHVGGLAIVDPSRRTGGPVGLDEVAACITDRLRGHFRLRQRLLTPVPVFTRPVWIDDMADDAVVFALAMSYPVAFIGRALIGIGSALIFLPALKSLGAWFAASQFATSRTRIPSSGATITFPPSGPLENGQSRQADAAYG